MTDTPDLFAYVGEDEMGSGEVGLKAGVVPAGVIPLVATRRGKIDRADIRAQLQAQVDEYGKPIRLVRYAPVEELFEIQPNR